jgi:hypothetical protein
MFCYNYETFITGILQEIYVTFQFTFGKYFLFLVLISLRG